MVRARPGLLLLGILLVGSLAGCLGDDVLEEAPEGEQATAHDPWEDWREGVRFDTTSTWPVTLEAGRYEVGEHLSFALARGDGGFVPVVPGVLHHEIDVRVDVWYPADLPRTEVPVVIQASPYHPGDLGRIAPGSEEAEFYVPTLVEKGIAYARYAVRGSSESSGCTDPLSAEEQADLEHLIDFIAVRGSDGSALSNGNVGFIGASYPGVQAWAAAATGHPAVKTVVPIAAFPDLYGFHEWNGTWRTSATLYPHNYWLQAGAGAYGGVVQRTPHAAEMLLCPDMATSVAEAQGTWITGEAPGLEEEYWQIRDLRDRIVDRYEGSVFLIHGFQDQRVPLDNAYPFVERLTEKGNDVKMLLGQWGHIEPWKPALDEAQLRDQAETLWRWFDRYLNENESQVVGPRVDVQADDLNWRTEVDWPPEDAATEYLYYGGDGALDVVPQPTGSSIRVGLPGSYPGPKLFTWEFETTLDGPLHLVGTPQLRATFVPTTPRVVVGAWLMVEHEGVLRQLAGSPMDLRYADGTGPHDVAPGEPVTAHLQLTPLDAAVAAGDRLLLVLAANTGMEPMPGVPQPAGLRWGGEDSWVRIQTIDRSAE